MKREFTAVFEDGEEGWITAYIEEVPGAVTQGRTIDEARDGLREALDLVLSAQRELRDAKHSHELARETLSVDVPG